MKCQKEWIRESLPEYLADRLSKERAQKISEHLDRCRECRQELTLLRHLVDEPVQEPSSVFWSTLPGRVTSLAKERRRRLFHPMAPVWAGGFAVAALVVLLLVSPWKSSRLEVELPGGYYTQMTGQFDPGLEEEILSLSGVAAVDLGRSIERDISLSEEIYGLNNLNDMGQSGFYEGMDINTLKVFENLIDDLSKVSS